MPVIKRSSGENKTEKIVSKLCDNTFLNLWVYPNPYKTVGKELCDVLVVFEDNVFIFSIKEIKFNLDKKLGDSWDRWKRKAIDDSIKQALGAEKWIKQHPERLFLDAKCNEKFPINIPKGNFNIYKIIVAHGAEESCKQCSSENVAGSLAIMYSDKGSSFDLPFYLNLDKNNIVHILDDYNLEIVLSELDTVTDFLSYFEIKEKTIQSLDALVYAGEEDLLAYYFRNLNETTGEHSIIPEDQECTILCITEGEWERFKKSQAYNAKKEADKISYFWDELIQKTAQNAFDGTLIGNADVFNGHSPIKEMAKEPRFIRRALSNNIQQSIERFPETEQKFFRHVSTFFLIGSETAYVFFQLKYDKDKDFEKEVRPIRAKMLGIACGAFKNTNPYLKKIIGIAINAPKYSDLNSEDFILLNCEDWTKEDQEFYEKENEKLNFFKTDKLINRKSYIQKFPTVQNVKVGKIGRNEKCPCGSGKKYKRCCLDKS